MKFNLKSPRGYTLIELMIVVTIIAILSSLVSPRFDLLLQRARQSKAKNNLGNLRTALAMYYSATEGNYPLSAYGPGNDFYTNDNLSLTSVLVPAYLPAILPPQLADRAGGFNGLGLQYDQNAINLMSKNPPEDVFIVLGPQGYTPLLYTPFAYDNHSGVIYIANGNYDSTGRYFYEW